MRLLKEKLNIGFDFLALILGIIGLVGGLFHALYFPYRVIGILLFCIYGCGLLYFSQNNNIHYRRLMSIVCISGVVFIFILFSNESQNILRLLKDVIRYDYFLKFDELFKQGKIDNVLLSLAFMSIIGIPLTHLIVSFFYQIRGKILKMIFFIICFVFPILIHHQLEIYTSYCFLVFLIYIFIFHYCLKYQKQVFFLKCLVLSLVTIFLVGSHYFLEPNPIFKQGTSTVLTNITNWFDHPYLDDVFGNHNITGMSSSISGSLPNNDITLDKSIALTVESKASFTGYLRGYSLAHYQNNKWHAVNENYDDFDSGSLVGKALDEYHVISSLEVSIETMKPTRYQFVPYFSYKTLDMKDDSYYPSDNQKISIANIDIENWDIYDGLNSPIGLQKYNEYVKDEYLDVPDNLKDELTHLIEEKTSTMGLNINELQNYYTPIQRANIIKKILDKQAVYSLKTGKLPNDKDFIEYFLFENKKGSCTHFASSGAMLLRCLDVPTRYVSGYIIKSSDFENGKAEVSNTRSHAWIEIYVEDLGWIPVEMTPASSIRSQGTILDNLVENNQPATDNQPTQNPQTNQPTNQDQNNDIQDSQQVVEKENPLIEFFNENSQIIYTVGIVVILLAGYRLITTHLLKLRLKRRHNNEKIILYYKQMKKFKHSYVKVYDDALSLANKAKFSQHQIDDLEVEKMAELYQRYVKETYQSLPFYLKFLYKYIYGYI
ncbi:MAG: transglutaminase-like domain-containing protein [Longibaculum muris]|uniref:transglutaminase-like domain-containing protein n=1 Tax=Longibaculum muris TaxID=1796628 RepID=UPI002E765951|nr:transglutaminase-like domain-containing protein [Longibaculum muris]MED9813405.1 transglutaminase-like domain-containing protein [Longibaculum muris]